MVDCLLAHWAFYGCLALAAVLSAIPFIGKFLNVFNTMIHESGHAVMALFTGGGVMQIKLSADTSGAAQTKSKYWLGKLLTSLAGYPASAITAWFFFWLIEQNKYIYVCYVVESLILINLILWVRNTFGIIWLLVMGTLTFIVFIYGNNLVHYYYACCCAAILLFQSIYSSLVLVNISIKDANKAGDAKNLKDFTFIPAVIWAILFLIFVLWISYRILALLPCYK